MERPFPAYEGDEPYIFVSYAHDDAALVFPEITHLRDQGFNVWYDEGISPGSTWRDEVALALTQCKVFLYFVTQRSVASTNCLNEVNFCLSRERKILSVHLEQTDLPLGLELSLSAKQAIVRGDLAAEAYQKKLSDSLKSLLPRAIEPLKVPIGEISQATESSDKSIAVLPLVNQSNDPDNEYLCHGISAELVRGLSQIDGLRVKSGPAFQNQNPDVRIVGNRLNVDGILSGSIQKSANRIRVSFRLDQVKDGATLWSERYDRELDDIFELQDDVAQQVVAALRIELVAHEHNQLIDVGTHRISAYNAYLLGMHERQRLTRQSVEQAIDHFRQAVDLAPTFGRAYWSLCGCYATLMTVFGLPRENLAAQADAAATQAREAGFLPPFPWIEVQRQIHPDTRPDQRQLAVEACSRIRDPDSKWPLFGYRQLGLCLAAVGLFHSAVDCLEQYQKTGPQDGLSGPPIEVTFMSLLCCLGRFDRAIELRTELIAGRPDVPLVISERAMLYSRTGQYEKAEQDLATLAKMFPRNFAQFYHLYWRRELDAAKAYFDWLEKRKNLFLLPKYWGCFLLGETEKGLDYVEEDLSRGAPAFNLRSDLRRALPQSIYRQVERHPRFRAILEELGIDDTWRDELMGMANDITDVTGIHVQLDEAY
jgi:TolB-like protein